MRVAQLINIKLINNNVAQLINIKLINNNHIKKWNGLKL